MEAGEQEHQEPPRRSRRPPGVEESQEDAAVEEVIVISPVPLPLRNFDRDTTEPISFYFSSLEEVLAWTPTSDDAFNICNVPLAPRQPPLHSGRPRTLVCHDMMGGYLEDRFVQGSATPDPYVFYHWQHIDIFVYFSHRLLTIPPVGWTNAAHRHGVSVLGTLITEWTEGASICEMFLGGTEDTFRAVADQLVRIAQFFGFDGWLVNIENVLTAAAVSNAPRFLRYLTEELHRQVPGSLVLWYDSVVEGGQLKWQDELNEKNRVFFEACDGLFTNYNWREEHLERTAAAAGARPQDVYVGVDVFARGSVVGGRFETDKSLALIRKHKLSAALFAPGWVYECLDRSHFLRNQDRFWGLLRQHLSTHSVSALPLVTSFCLGTGSRRFYQGQEVGAGPWFHLSAQDPQPLSESLSPLGGPGGWAQAHRCPEEAWTGGSCLLVHGWLPDPDGDRTGDAAVRLFSLQMPAPPTLFLSLVYRPRGPTPVSVSLSLSLADDPAAGHCPSGRSSEPAPRPLEVPPPLLAKWPGSCRRPHPGGWIQRCYEVSVPGCRLRDLFVRFSRPPGSEGDGTFSCLLGEVQVVDAESPAAPGPRVRDVTVSQPRWRRPSPGAAPLLSCTLHWASPPARRFRVHWRPPAAPALAFLGLAHSCRFRVVDLPVGGGRRHPVQFLVEPEPLDGSSAPEDQWGRRTLTFSGPGPGP